MAYIVTEIIVFGVTIVTAVVGAYYVTSEPWAEACFGWAVGGLVAGVVLCSTSTCILWHYEREMNDLLMQQL